MPAFSSTRIFGSRSPGLLARFCVALCGTLALAAASTAAQTPAGISPSTETTPLDRNIQDLAILNRVSWGASTAAAQALQKSGLEGYLGRQLNPPDDDGLPPAAQSQIEAMEISRKSVVEIVKYVSLARKKLQALKGSPQYDDAQKAFQQQMSGYARESATRALLRDLYSQNQLKEQLTWFWMNHFNVSQNKGDIRATVGDYEENAIRPHVLGKFSDLLQATMFHPAMLQYLDNAQNARDHINENYAREIMELHTLGVGSGYTQKDVQELARILTGVGVDLSGNATSARHHRPHDAAAALVTFDARRHDFGKKVFLGTPIKGSGTRELAEALLILNLQPPTAYFISKKLAVYFCCDTPPPPLVAAMTATFRATGGDIAAVLKTMFAAPEFRASLGQKFKDPVHYAVSALRVSYGDTVIVNAQPLFNWINRMAEPLYGHETPDGYAMTEAAWSGPGEMETRFEIARAIGIGRSGLFKAPGDKTPEPVPPPNIRTTPYYAAIAPALAAPTQDALSQAGAPADWNLLFLSSPEFMHR